MNYIIISTYQLAQFSNILPLGHHSDGPSSLAQEVETGTDHRQAGTTLALLAVQGH